MLGQGRPHIHGRVLGWLLSIALALCAPAAADEIDVRLRIAWGGGEAKPWQGTIHVTGGELADVTPLGLEADAPGSIVPLDADTIRVAPTAPRSYDGCDLRVQAAADAKLLVQLWAGEGPDGPPLEVPLGTAARDFVQFDLDQENNRLLAHRAPGDALRVKLQRDSLVFSPGETLEIEIQPHVLDLAAGTNYVLAAALAPARGDQQLWNEDDEIQVTATRQAPAVALRIPVPPSEGAYDLKLALYPKRLTASLIRPKPLATRQVQFVVVAPVQRLIPQAPWQRVLEFDPTSPKWWERLTRLPSWTRLPNVPQQPVSSSPPGQRQHLGRTWLSLAPQAWQACPLSIAAPGAPHLIEIEYPSDLAQTLSISLVEPNVAGKVGPIGLDSGIDVPPPSAGHVPQVQRHRLICWPQTRTPYLLLINRRDDAPAVFGKINVLAGPAELPPLTIPQPAFPARALAAYYAKPLVVENFSAREALDPASGRNFDDWVTFLEAGQRLIQTLQHGGYSALVLTVACEGSAIYPSRLLEPTPKYDTGVFFESGQDPQRKDVLELLMRLCDRSGIQLIPAIEFSSPLPELEAIRQAGGPEADGLAPIGPDGRTWMDRSGARRGMGVHYNPLDARVQRAMTAVVGELAERYGRHACFGGVAVHLGSESYALLPDETCSFDDVTIASFARQAGAVLPVSMDESPLAALAARADFLRGPGHAAWLDWRSAQLTTLFTQMRDEVVQRRADARLYLTTAELLGGQPLRQAMRPTLPANDDPAALLPLMGLDLPRLAEEGIVVPRPQRIVPASSPATRDLDRHWNAHPALDAAFSRFSRAAGLHYLPPAPLRLPQFDAVSPFGADKTRTLLISQLVPAAAAQRERFIRSLIALDASLLIDGGWLLPLGQEDALAPLVKVYRRLPAERFADARPAKEAAAPPQIAVRTLAKGGKTYFYVANGSPWPVTVHVVFQTPQAAPLVSYADERQAQTAQQPGRLTWTVAMEPHDLVGGEIAAAGAVVVDWQVTPPADAKALLEKQILDATRRSNALRWPLAVTLVNPSFETPPLGGRPIPGWVFGSAPAAPGAGGEFLVEVDRGQGAGSPASLHVVSRPAAMGPAPIVWVRSDSFTPAATGRLRLVASIRVADAARQPKLRLAIEGKLDGQTYYRRANVGASELAGGPAVTPLTTKWVAYPFQLDDLPTSGLSELRVGFDLMGEGEVWIDDVQVFDLWFEPHEWHELLKSAAAAAFQRGEGRLLESQAFVDSYWPSFLRRHVTLPQGPATGPLAGQPGAAPAAAPPAAPREDKSPPTTWQRMQSWLPSWPQWR